MSDDLIKRSDAIKAVESEDCFAYIECKAEVLYNRINAIPSADRPQGDVDAVTIFMREMHNLKQGYITTSEFDERIEPLRHLCYGRPQGEWIDKGRNLWGCSNCGMEIYSESEKDRNEFHKWCSRCGAQMKGADNEN